MINLIERGIPWPPSLMLALRPPQRKLSLTMLLLVDPSFPEPQLLSWRNRTVPRCWTADRWRRGCCSTFQCKSADNSSILLLLLIHCWGSDNPSRNLTPSCQEMESVCCLEWPREDWRQPVTPPLLLLLRLRLVFYTTPHRSAPSFALVLAFTCGILWLLAKNISMEQWRCLCFTMPDYSASFALCNFTLNNIAR